jgi:hypothetical protein
MKINGLEIPDPKKIDVEPVEISVKSRTASGLLVKDITAIKRNFSLSYQGLKPENTIIFKNIYYAGNAVSLEYEDAEGTQTANVFINTLPHSLLKQNPKLSQNVTITLEEV